MATAQPVAPAARLLVPPPVEREAAGPAPAVPAPVAPAAVPPAPLVAPELAPVPRLSPIETVLSRYAQAFNTLDLNGAKAIWPAVNERGLARAFASVAEQRLHLGDCDIEISPPRATASCSGMVQYVPKVGSRSLRAERRSWSFVLQQRGDEWVIDSVTSR